MTQGSTIFLRKLRADIDAILEDDEILRDMGERPRLTGSSKRGLLAAAVYLDGQIKNGTVFGQAPP